MSYARLNPDAGADNTLKVPKFASVSAMPTRTVGTDTGTFTGIALNASMTKVSIDGETAVDITAIPLANDAGTGISASFAASAQRAIAEVMGNAAKKYIDIDNLTVSIAIVDASPDTFTVTITQTGEATVTSVYIGGATKTLART